MAPEIKRWGNTLALRIPHELLRSIGLAEGSRVRLEVENGKLVVAPDRLGRLEALLAALESHGGPDPYGELEL